ncbi:MAG: OmpA family protein [Planctomycetaceae bacterium]|nr:OmpA family protein [Planctomycetaceae bacterium]
MALKIEQDEPGVPEWVVTFGDMMSLLLTFFVLLFSMSEIKQEHSQAIVQSLRQRFGHENSIAAMVPGPVSPMNSAIARLASMGRAQRMNTMNGGDKVKAPVGDHARVRAIRPADETTLGGLIEFPEGEGDLSAEAIKTIEATAAIVKGKPQKIEVRGHTTARPLPPESPYCNHWDLAYARAFLVRQQLVKCGVEEQRLRISIAAENEPQSISPVEEERRKNARVEILMLDELTKDLVGTAEERQQKYSAAGDDAPTRP